MLVTKQAPSFTGSAFHKGQVKEVSIDDYRGKWVVLCFYPGDFHVRLTHRDFTHSREL